MRKPFARAVRDFWNIHVVAEDPPNIIPSINIPPPNEWYGRFMGYTKSVRTAQETFNQDMDAIVKERGLSAVSNMTFDKAKESKPAKEQQIVYRLRWQQFDPNDL